MLVASVHSHPPLCPACAAEGANGAAAGAGSEVLGGMSVKELYEILSEMRKLVQQNPEQARTILVKQPAMTRALFHAQLKLGMLQASPRPGPWAPCPPLIMRPPLTLRRDVRVRYWEMGSFRTRNSN